MTITTERPSIRVREDLPELNVDLLQKLLTWAVGDHDLDKRIAAMFEDWGIWNQDAWAIKDRDVCKTAYCIAGQAVAQSDYGLIMEDDGDGGWEAGHCAPITGYTEKFVKGKKVKEPILDEEGMVPIEFKARELMGLTPAEASSLFNGDNEIDRVVSFGVYFARRRGLTLELPQPVWAHDEQYRDSDVSLWD